VPEVPQHGFLDEAFMIDFQQGDRRFIFRIAGVVLDRGRVLLVTAEGIDFWFLPGGRAEFLEPSEETLRREMREEIGTRIKVGRLLWVVENFFGNGCHEIGFYYNMDLTKNSHLRRLESFPGNEESQKLTFKWHQLNELDKIRLLPWFLQTELTLLPTYTKHIVHHDS